MTATERRPDASMTLLTEMMERPLDPGYAAAAERREAAGLAPSTSTRGPLVVTAAMLIGFVVVVAALALRPTGTTASRDKAQLIEQIEARQEHGDAQAAAVSQLRTQVKAYQDAALGAQQSRLTDELARLGMLTGETAAAGPGLVLTIDDATEAKAGGGLDPRAGGGFSEGRVTATDLQIVTNGLWAVGAEAVSVNGQRLTARSAIRFAGQAILVDFRPLTPPYELTVIGDPVTLRTRFAATAAGAYLKALADTYAIRSSDATRDRVEVPRSPALELRFARTVAPGIPSSPLSAAPSGSGPAAATTRPPVTPSPRSPTSKATP